MGVWLSFGAYFTHFPTPPPGNNFTVPYYFIYFFNNLLTVINIYKYFNMQLSIKLNYILYMYYQHLRAKSIQWSIINAVFWLVELLLGYML